jgi:hypothetical protein
MMAPAPIMRSLRADAFIAHILDHFRSMAMAAHRFCHNRARFEAP